MTELVFSLPIEETVFTPTSRRIPGPPHQVRKLTGEFWTSAQRRGNPIHEVSYRACFKPQVPAFFITQFSKGGETVLDPFMGRGTTVIEARLHGRKAIGNDANPLSTILVEPRIDIPSLDDVERRLSGLRLKESARADIDLSMFFHRRTEGELVSLQRYLACRRQDSKEDRVDKWIRMVATNRLSGHSPGFFSVYTLPPNQAATPEQQKRINRQRRQRPPYRNVKELILRKSKRLLGTLSLEDRTALTGGDHSVLLSTGDARRLQRVEDGTIGLTVTSPPFLDIVDYGTDNWLRCWFNRIDVTEVSLRCTRSRTLTEWSRVMQEVMRELYRVTKRGGYVAFEVGEVRKNTINLDEVIVPLGIEEGFEAKAILINSQKFTKTSNIWGIQNNVGGTNTNRVVLFRKV